MQPLHTQPDPLAPDLVQQYMLEYQTHYRFTQVRHMTRTPDLRSCPPFTDICGIVRHPESGYLIWCDSRTHEYRRWLLKHPDYQNVYYNGRAQNVGYDIKPSITVHDTRFDQPRTQRLSAESVQELLQAGNSVALIADLYGTSQQRIQKLTGSD